MAEKITPIDTSKSTTPALKQLGDVPIAPIAFAMRTVYVMVFNQAGQPTLPQPVEIPAGSVLAFVPPPAGEHLAKALGLPLIVTAAADGGKIVTPH